MEARWANFCIEKVNQETSSIDGKGQWEVVGKYDWTKLFAVKLWTKPEGSGYPYKDICPEYLDFPDLNRRTIRGEKLQKDIKVRVARGNLVPKYQREYDALADEDDSVKISEGQSEFMQNTRDFMFHWYLVEPYWKAADGSEQETTTSESDSKVILTYKDGGPRLPASGTDTSKTIQEIRRLLNKLEEEISNSVPEETVVEEDVVLMKPVLKKYQEETQTELSEDEEIDRLLNEDPMSSEGE